jgi:hypothetical protein
LEITPNEDPEPVAYLAHAFCIRRHQ